MDALQDPDTPVDYYDLYREYRVFVLNGGSGISVIEFCPWCGEGLPASLRDRWFESIRALGLEPEDELPPDLRDGTWWREMTRE